MEKNMNEYSMVTAPTAQTLNGFVFIDHNYQLVVSSRKH